MGKAAFTKAAVTRFVEAVKEGGVEVGTVEVTSEGLIRVTAKSNSDLIKLDDPAIPKRWVG